MKADVQLEHGYVRIANRLLEAILDAEFTGTQVRILMTLVRLTYGWQQRTARISVSGLAGHCRMSPVGGFRRALYELIAAGVVLEIERGSGAHASVFAVQKDFTRWGRYSIAPGRLESVWGERPDNVDNRLQPTLFGSPLDGVPAREGDPRGLDSMTLEGHTVLPSRVTPSPPNHNSERNLAAPKDSERQRKTIPPPPPRAREAFAHRLDDATIAVVDDFLAQVPPDTTRRWIAMVDGWLDGMDIRAPAPTTEDLRVGLTHYLAGAERDYSPMHVRTFVERAARERMRAIATPPPSGNGYHTPNGDAAAAVFNDLVSWIQTAGGYKHITPEKFRELPGETREALREIGGHRAVAEADAKGLRILRAQFCRVYRARASPV